MSPCGRIIYKGQIIHVRKTRLPGGLFARRNEVAPFAGNNRNLSYNGRAWQPKDVRPPPGTRQ